MPKFFAPALTPILQSRKVSLIIIGATVSQLLWAFFGFPGWQCPLLHAFGIPCPGCGLTRACLALLHGEWQQALTIHAFALFMPLALIFISIGVLPARHKQQFIVQVEKIERRTGIFTILLLALLAYWLVRLVFFRTTFIRLIAG